MNDDSFAYSPNPSRYPNRGLLIDLDNLGVPAIQLLSLLGRILDAAGPLRWAVASAHPLLLERSRHELTAYCIDQLPAEEGRNGADRTLLSAAHAMWMADWDEVVVCSHDNLFRCMRLPYHLIVTGREPVAKSLAAFARSTTYLPPGEVICDWISLTGDTPPVSIGHRSIRSPRSSRRLGKHRRLNEAAKRRSGKAR